MTEISVVKQAADSARELKLIALGQAKQLSADEAGLITFEFSDRQRVQFNSVSSVLYVDELLASEANFPYPKQAGFQNGLYECFQSTYLRRIQEDRWISGNMFKNHRHFVYWDNAFFWNITCESISILK